jgi:ATP-dependent helicase HrpB
MVGGTGVRLAPESVVRREEFFLALDARDDPRSQNREALVRIASGIEPQWLEQLFPAQIRRERGVVYDAQRDRVVGRGATYYRDLPIREDSDAAVDPDLAAAALVDFVAPNVVEFFESNEDASEWLARLALLQKYMPEQPWPTMETPAMLEVLARAARGKRSIAELRKAPLAAILSERLSYPLDRAFEQHAPRTIAVPTGNEIRLKYSKGERQVLAVRLQEIFGWLDTPKIAGGRVPVVMHLLAPNYRPVQITDDLRSFWSTTYFQVRKDLRVRYPKHSWPEDPLTAKPEAKGGRRRAN